MEIFNTIIIHPIINVLVAIYQVLFALHVPYALGFAIIGLTMIIRLILYPFINAQMKTSKKMQAIAPHISHIKSKHKGDSKRIQEETQKLYKEHGINPLAGCLPTLIQLPIIFGLYNVLNSVVHKSPNEVVSYINSIVIPPLALKDKWDPYFFGIPLGKSPQQLFTEGSKEGMLMLIIIGLAIPLITGLFQFVQSKMMFSTPPEDPKLKLPANKKGQDDFATVFQKQSAYIFPVMIGIFSFTLPFGLSLYWNTFSIFGIIQQYKISGWGGMEDLWLKAKKLTNR